MKNILEYMLPLNPQTNSRYC